MEFQEYQHIERFGTDEVLNIELGKVNLQPKIDGTNGSVWINNGEVQAGSRKKQLSLEKDNHGFYKYILTECPNIHAFLNKYSQYRLFGEFLVPHSLKTYNKDAWNKFYVFDVAKNTENGGLWYISYEEYKPLLEEFEILYIPVIATVENGDYDKFVKLLDTNVFLIEDGKGVGEGIILKNYKYTNKYGRCTWAKIVKNEFKTLHSQKMGATDILGKKMVENEISIEFCTEALVDKIYAKIVNECDGWNSKYIPRLLETVYYEIITEESWHFIKKHKNPTINFATLRHFILERVKQIKTELF